MADPLLQTDPVRDAGRDVGNPRHWVKVFGIIALIVFLLLSV